MLSSPFGNEPIAEVPLGRSPLVRVVAQVRFPQLVAMVEPDISEAMLRIGRALAAEYPIYSQQHETILSLGPDGVTQTQGASVSQYRSGDDRWRVTVGQAFISLEDWSYTTRGEFVERLGAALAAFSGEIAPPYAERVGVRYINRIDDQPALDRIVELVRPEVLGGLAVPLTDGVALAQMLSESLYSAGDRWLLARWGLLPAGATVDPTLRASASASWLLDLDSFVQGRLPFDDTLGAVASGLAEAAYRYFRWVVSPEFLRMFGGEV